MKIFKFITDNWEIIASITTLLGPILAWIVGRKRKEAQLLKERAEAKDVELGTISTNFKMYQELINDLEERFKKRILELEDDLERMRLLNQESRKQISSLERFIKKLQNKIQEYEKLEE